MSSDSIVSDEVQAPRGDTPERQGQREFLCTLFRGLDENQIRYCVLHSWEELPQNVSSDLDVAVHPDDNRKLKAVFQAICAKGYRVINVINYFVEAYCFRFVWLDGPKIFHISVDIIFRHQRGVACEPSATELVNGRSRRGLFWIPTAEKEFTFLLARRSWKTNVAPRQENRLKSLIEELGTPAAQKLAGQLFVGKFNVAIVQACVANRLNALLSKARPQLCKTSALRKPFALMADILSEATRLFRRWLNPSGFFVAVMGPDGVGKSTLLEQLFERLSDLFDHHRRFHWRPNVFGPRKAKRNTAQPHSLPAHGLLRSIIRVFVHVLDYWAGYWLLIRPVVARSGLVLFDRYFDDIMIDPKRYRYGGPMWLLRMLRPLVPKPDLLLVLDAPTSVILSRKQEVAEEEGRQQRKRYRRCQQETPNSRLIDASAPLPEVVRQSSSAIVELLARRCCRRYPEWLAVSEI